MPQTLIVTQGERITWVNKDPFPHTVTADSKAFDSGTLAPGMTWSFVARAPGRYAYGCSLHPSMKGMIIVRAPAQPGDRQ